MLDAFIQFDRQLLLLINPDKPIVGIDWLFYVVSHREYFALPVLVLTYIWITLSKQKNTNLKLCLSFLMLLISVSLAEFLKYYLSYPRPCSTDLIGSIYFLGELREACYSYFGFPSSHSWAFWGFAYFHCRLIWFDICHANYQKQKNFSSWVAMILIFIAVLVSISRVYLSAHFPHQVLAGAIGGTFISHLFFLLYKKILG